MKSLSLSVFLMSFIAFTSILTVIGVVCAIYTNLFGRDDSLAKLEPSEELSYAVKG